MQDINRNDTVFVISSIVFCAKGLNYPYVRGSNNRVISKEKEMNVIAEPAEIKGEIHEFSIDNIDLVKNIEY